MVCILGIETERGLCSAALYADGAVHERAQRLERMHNEHILKLVDEAVVAAGLRPRQLDAVAFGCGPGSFTGIRLAASVAQAAALGAGAKVLPVSSSLALAVAAVARMTAGSVAGGSNPSPKGAPGAAPGSRTNRRRGSQQAGVAVSIRSRRDAFYLASFSIEAGEPRSHRADRLFDACPNWDDFAPGWPLVGDPPPWLPAEVEVLAGVAAGAGLIARLGAAALAAGGGLAPEFGLPTYVPGDSPWRPAA